MNLFEYALRAYNLLLDLVMLILSPFVGPLRYLVIGGLVVIVAGGVVLISTWRKRRHARTSPPPK